MADSLRGLKVFLQQYANLIESRKQDVDIADQEFQYIKQQAVVDKKSLCALEGAKEANKKKNRYKDILPYDHSRVILPKDKFIDGSDYINANNIKDFSGNLCYIASQGPMPTTVNDFWKMILNFKVKLVVMACKEVELGKARCQRYWPYRNETLQFKDIIVTMVNEKQYAKNMKMRELKAVRKGKEYFITQLHYMDWPDHGAPETSETILQLISIVREKHMEDQPPLLVHCSAGCGRTGAIIGIDLARKLIQNKAKSISVYDIVTHLRKQRPAMVQTKEQYEFLYEVVREMVTAELAKNDGAYSDDNSTYVNMCIIPEFTNEKTSPADHQSEILHGQRESSTNDEAFIEVSRQSSKKQIILPSEHLLNTDTAGFRRSRSLYGKNSPRSSNRGGIKAPPIPRKASESTIIKPQQIVMPVKQRAETSLEQRAENAVLSKGYPALPPNKPKSKSSDGYVNVQPSSPGFKLNEEFIPAPKPAIYNSYPMKSTTYNPPLPMKPTIVSHQRQQAVPTNSLLHSAADKMNLFDQEVTQSKDARNNTKSNKSTFATADIMYGKISKSQSSNSSSLDRNTDPSYIAKSKPKIISENDRAITKDIIPVSGNDTGQPAGLIKPYYVAEIGTYGKKTSVVSNASTTSVVSTASNSSWKLSVESGSNSAPPLPKRTPESFEVIRNEEKDRGSSVNHKKSGPTFVETEKQQVQYATPVDAPPSPNMTAPSPTAKHWYHAISKMKMGKKQHTRTTEEVSSEKSYDEFRSIGFPKRITQKIQRPSPQPSHWPVFPS